MKVSAFIFDLDGVLTDTAEFHYLAWKDCAAALGIEIDREFNETLKGISRIDSLERILILGGRQNDFTPTEKEIIANKKNDAYVELIKKISPADLLPGVEDFLRSIADAGYKIAMASASKNAMAVSKLLGIDHYFHHIVDAATVAQSKPHPEVFLKAADAVGVAPENCIGIEDAAAGVDAILSAGMYAVGVGDKDILSKAHIVLESTAQLKLNNILEELNENICK
ncbi:MAG: beta-phosphoglucomutase [Defluviitaleaceae bacterium]|nr:beta-phosphoglucomutase [Defluviitaleaceae bacterium]